MEGRTIKNIGLVYVKCLFPRHAFNTHLNNRDEGHREQWTKEGILNLQSMLILGIGKGARMQPTTSTGKQVFYQYSYNCQHEQTRQRLPFAAAPLVINNRGAWRAMKL